MKPIGARSLLGGIFFWLAITTAQTQTAQTNLAVTVRHAPSLNGGTIQGSLQQLSGEGATANGGFAMTGDWLVPGTPTLLLNGNPTYSGTIAGSGSTSPTGYQVTLNGNCSLRYLRTRTTPVSLPNVPPPPSPTGTRNVTINSAGQSYGDTATLRDLTLNGNVGMIAVPPGTYGTFTVNGGSGLVLGVAGGLQTVNYNLQNMNLNGNSTLKIVGPVILTVANGFTANGTVGASNNPAWLQLKIASGGFTLNSGCIVYGLVQATNGTVIINGNSTLVGTSASDQFILNGGGLVKWASSSLSTSSQPPVATNQTITLAENSSTNITLAGSDPQGLTLTYTVLTQPAHGTLSGTPPGVTYRPATNYYGNDAFTFSVNNGVTNSAAATIALAITQVYYSPTPLAQSLTNFEDTALPVTLTGYDPQGYTLTFSVLTQPAHGTLSGTAPNLAYLPATNYFGNDSFTFRVNDGVSNSLAATISITNKPVDDAPLVVAGANQLIILPTNFVYLAGSVSYDAYFGTSNSVFWSKVSGPGSVTFSSPSNILTTATFGTNGVYRLRLSASDSFLTGSNDLWVTVDAPPVVSAGQAMTNTFPGTVTLLGSASDDGLPTNGTLNVVWSKVSGPGTVVFGNAATTNSAATFGTNGIYVLRLIADDSIATNHSDVTVIENLPPTVNAGTDILTNGLNALLKGTASDDGLPGSFLASQWSQSTGPGTITFANASATNTTVTASQSGTYILVLTANDGAATNSGALTITFNLPPVVNAGSTQTVNFGTTVTLAGSVTDDQLPHNFLNSTWSKVSGPGNVTFADASLTNTTATFDQSGTYTLRLTATDTLATTNADVVIRVNAAPVVNAGTNQLVTFGTLVALAGSYTDDGIPGATVTTVWTQSGGPAGAVFADPAAVSTTVSFSQSGVYVFQLTADDEMTNGSAQVTITVDQAPTVTAVSPLLINWPANQTVLNGTVTDDGFPNGGILTSIWSQISGTSPVNFSTPSSTSALNGSAIITQPSTAVTFSTPGLYVLRLTSNDGQAANHADVVVTVNQVPTVNAGTNQIIALPVNQVVLKGTATDDGLPVGNSLTTTWSKVSGQGVVAFANANATNTTATFGTNGVYVLQLTASDGVSSSTSTVTVTVDQAPVVALATPAVITWPGNQVVLNGQVTDDGLPPGGILSETFSLVSGPGTASFSPATMTNILAGTVVSNFVSSTATFSASGSYVVRLTANDGLASASTNVTVTVNQAPIVNAGISQTVASPGALATLNGTATDDGLPAGSTVSVNWSKVSGPGTVAFGNAAATNTMASFDQPGLYVLRLSASDTIATSTSDVALTVQSANQPPVLNAGNSQTNLFPAPAHLAGTATDDGLPVGSVLTSTWSVVSGPGTVTFDNANLTNATAAFSLPGVYVLQLEVGDSQLAASNQVVIIEDVAPQIVTETNLFVSSTNQISLSAGLSDDGLPPGAVMNSVWNIVSGPGTAVFSSPSQTNALAGAVVTNQLLTTATFSQPGVYVLSLTADDSVATNTVQIHVALNQAPQVDAGANQTIQFGQSAALLGFVLDDGLPAGGSLAIRWTVISGPGNVMIDDPGSAETSAHFSMAGTYVLRLAADDGVATNFSDTIVTVKPANNPPFVRVGPKQIVVLPAVASLNGSVTDDGLPAGSSLTTAWSKVSGPGTVTFSDAAAASTTASFSEAGNYVLRLTADDSALAGHADLQIVVRTPAMNQPPLVSAGSNKVVGLTNVVALEGTVADDGLPQGAAVSAYWSLVSGPGSATFEDASVTNTGVSFSAVGTYDLRLTANDSALSASNDVQVTVYPFNQPPTVYAGTNQTIIMPDPDTLMADGLLPTNPAVELSLSLLSAPHWNYRIGQPGLDGGVGNGCLSWSGSHFFVSGGFVSSGTNFIGSVAKWDGTNWVGLFDMGLLYPGGPPFGNPAWHGEDGYAANNSYVYESTSRGEEVFINGGFLAARHPDAGQETLRWDGAHWQTWGVQGVLPFYSPRQMLATSNTVYELFDLFKPTYGRSYGGPATWADTNWLPYLATNVYTPDVDLMPTYEGLATWNGGDNWGALGDLMQIYTEGGWLTSVAIGKHGEVYIAGEFYLDTPTGVAYGVAMWNGTNWCALGDGITGRKPQSDIYGQLYYDHLWINGMTVDYAGNLYVVGEFSQAGGKTVNGIAKWDGTNWSDMAGGIGWDGESVAAYGRDIYVGGQGLYANGLPFSYVLRWDGARWHTLSQGGIAGGAVMSLAAGPAGIMMAGGFNSAGGQTANNVAYWEYPPLPSKFAYLNGKVTDDGLPVGSVLTSQWTKQSGSGEVTFGSVTNPVTTATFSKAGTYVLRLTASDGEYTRFDETTVIVHGNEPPVVDAGSNQVVGVDGAVVMNGSASDDGIPEGAQLEVQWTLINGPGTVRFDDPTDPHTAVTFSTPGVYVLRLSANDTIFTTHSDVTIQVLDGNAAPSVQAWTDNGTVTQPNAANLFAIISDDGNPTNGTLTSLWSQVSGPGTVAFADANANDTTVSFPQVGTYVLRMTASDSQLSSSADVTIQAVAPGGQSPLVIAGFNQQVTLPGTVSLSGVAVTNGINGNTQVHWNVLSGPGNVTFSNQYSTATTASFDTPGVYDLQLELDEEFFYWGWSWWGWVASDHLYVTVNPAAGVNQPPVTYAGPPRTVPLGVPVQLHGQATDDGLPSGDLSMQWQFVDGPATVEFADRNALVTTVTFTNAGQYDLQLWASDSQLESASGLQINVVDLGNGNHPPVVDPGTNQTISSGYTAQLQGSVSDDGLPGGVLNHHWTMIRGPDAVTFDDNQSPTAVITFNTQGAYVFRLRADDGVLVTEADVTITVDHPINQAPTVDAGPAQQVAMTETNVTLAGSVTDDGLPAGGALNYHWEVADAPGEVDFDNSNSLTAVATFVDPPFDLYNYYGYYFPMYYRLRLVADDSKRSATNEVAILLVDPRDANRQLDVSAGDDQTVAMVDGAQLSGTRSFSSEYGQQQWKMISGPGTVSFDQPWSLQTAAHFSKPGVYVLRLQAFDFANCGASQVTIMVLPPLSHLVVDAGPSGSIPIQFPTAVLNGFAGDDASSSNGDITAAWSVISGPGNVTFADGSSPVTTATFDTLGTYTLRLLGQNLAATNTSDVTVIVYDPTQANQPPFVDAGTEQTVALPQTAVLSGTVVDDGLPGAGLYQYWNPYFNWSQVSGPYQADIADSGSLNTTAAFHVPGDYIFRLNAGDGLLANSADVMIHVLAASNQPPLIYLTMLSPAALGTPVNLGAFVLDDGLPAGGGLDARWSVAAGPGAVTFAHVINSFPAISAQASFSVAGDYTLQLVATDGELTSTSQVPVTVFNLYQGNLPPVVNAGPVRSATTLYPIALHGTVTDDGLPVGSAVSSLWSMENGPVPVRFANAASPDTSATFYQAGTYILRLSATDGQLAGNSLVMVTVSDPTNLPPQVYAGSGQTVTRPAAALLDGLVLDDGLPLGYPLTYQWKIVSGPGTVTFATDVSTNADVSPWQNVDFFDASAEATFSTNGTYVLQLSASDTEFTNTDEVTITVLPGVNSPPTVDAGSDQTIALPAAAVLHTGVADDGLPGGSLEISWSEVSGPGPVSFTTVNGIYHAGFTLPGSYVLRLLASDGELSSSNEVTVTVYGVTPGPIAHLDLPLDGSIITSPTQIVGTASSAILQGYELQYRLETPAGSNAWQTFATGSTSVVSNALGVLDPTLSLNGIYEVRLAAVDVAGRTATTDPITVIFDRNLKIGSFNISFNDLSVPVPGLPIQITRTYDSKAAAAGVRGDFGAGWTMDIRNVRLQKNRPLSRNWTESTTGIADDLSIAYHLDPGSPRIVSIIFPEGRVEKFQFQPNPMDQALAPIEYPRWNFVPIGDTHGTLVPAAYDDPDGHFMAFAGSIPGAADLYDLNYFMDWFDSTNTLADLQRYPTLFRYTSTEGYQYLIDEIGGLQSLTDPNGNTLVIGTDGVTWTNAITATSGVTIAFQRDDHGRITNILDRAGSSLQYRYDADGNLAGFTDRAGQTNGFAYTNTNYPHYLTGIINPQGITPLTVEYDSAGRMIRNTDVYGYAINYTHDIQNLATSVTDRNGNQISQQFDADGNLIKAVDPMGGITTCTYDDQGRRLSRTNPLGQTDRYIYEPSNGALIAVINALGQTNTFTYNANGKVTQATERDGTPLSTDFDSNNNIVRLVDTLGHATVYAYNSLGKPIYMRDALGHEVHSDYDEFGNLTHATNALGFVSQFAYNTNNQIVAQVMTRTVNGVVQTLTNSWGYDAQGRVIASISPDGSSHHTVYDELGHVASSIDEKGRATTHAYDLLGRLVQTTYPDGTTEGIAYDAGDRKIASTNRLGQVTRFGYDLNGRIVATVFPDGKSVTSDYDAAGRVVDTTDARGNSTWFGYDDIGRVTVTTNALGEINRFNYDARGNQIASTDALGRTTTNVFDLANRLVSVLYADGTSSMNVYDALGRKTSMTDQAGHTTSYGYDALGRLTAVTNAMNQVTRYEYDEVGEQTAQIDASGRVTRYQYDVLGRRTSRILPLGQADLAQFDEIGNMTTYRDFNGNTTSYQYDQLNRLIQKTPDARLGEAPITFGYNDLGQRTNMVDASGVTTYQYDGRNRLVQKITPEGALNYTYDANGNVATIQSANPNGTSVTYEYDVLNRLDSVTDAKLGRTAYGYDAVGNLTGFSYPNQMTTIYAYDPLNRLLAVTGSKQVTPVAGYAYTLTADGQRTSVAELNGRVVNYAYNLLNQLTNETVSGASSGYNGALNYNYDPVGNRLARNSSLPGILADNYAYDANDRLLSDAYDDNGNTKAANVRDPITLIAQPAADQYNFENQLTDRNNGQIRIVYDGDGNRVRKTVTTATNTVTTYYLVDGMNPSGYPQVVEELTKDTANPLLSTPQVTRTYTWGHTLLAQDQYAGGVWIVSYYGYDGQGSVRYLTDNAGQVTDTYDYDAFGNLVNRTGDTPNNYLYQGEQYDSDLKLYYLRARYADPDRGRFWTQDSFEGFGTDPASLHKYTFNQNNPVNRHDPSGHESLAEAETVVGLASEVRGALLGFVQSLTSCRLQSATASALIGGTVGGLISESITAIVGQFTGTAATGDELQQAYLQGLLEGSEAGFLIGLSPETAMAYGVYSTMEQAQQFFKDWNDPGVPMWLKYVEGAATVASLAVMMPSVAKKLNELLQIFCFPAGTEVATEEGQKPIEQIGVGDLVWAQDDRTGEVVLKPVKQLFVNVAAALVVLHCGTNTLEATPEHPLWVVNEGWKAAGQIQIGDELWTREGERVPVTAINHEQGKFTVYNFEVEDAHSYFVGTDELLAHNKCSLRRLYVGSTPGKTSWQGEAVIARMKAEGKIRINAETGEQEFYSQKAFEQTGQGWNPVSEADMAHKTAAVDYWNSTGRFYGPKSIEVRRFMLDPNNYELELNSINRVEGASMGAGYLPPANAADWSGWEM